MAKARDWIILRCAAGRTLLVADALSKAGIDTWTPRERYRRRKQGSKKEIEVVAPIAPTFVFARACHLDALAEIIHLPVSPYPQFSLFRFDGQVPSIADRELSKLREREAVAAPKAARRTIPAGTSVKLDEPAFVGLLGVVQDCDGKVTRVRFGLGLEVKIKTWLLTFDAVSASQPTGIAA